MYINTSPVITNIIISFFFNIFFSFNILFVLLFVIIFFIIFFTHFHIIHCDCIVLIPIPPFLLLFLIVLIGSTCEQVL